MAKEPQRGIWLDNNWLPIAGPVTWRRVTPFPAQILSGPQSVQDYTPTRKQRWAKMKGGMGLEKWEAGADDRYWTSDGVDPSLNVTTLSPLATTLGDFGKEPVKIIKFAEHIWAIGHNQISYWDGTEWQSVKTDFGNPTDAIIYFGAG